MVSEKANDFHGLLQMDSQILARDDNEFNLWDNYSCLIVPFCYKPLTDGFGV